MDILWFHNGKIYKKCNYKNNYFLKCHFLCEIILIIKKTTKHYFLKLRSEHALRTWNSIKPKEPNARRQREGKQGLQKSVYPITVTEFLLCVKLWWFKDE